MFILYFSVYGPVFDHAKCAMCMIKFAFIGKKKYRKLAFKIFCISLHFTLFMIAPPHWLFFFLVVWRLFFLRIRCSNSNKAIQGLTFGAYPPTILDFVFCFLGHALWDQGFQNWYAFSRHWHSFSLDHFLAMNTLSQ